MRGDEQRNGVGLLISESGRMMGPIGLIIGLIRPIGLIGRISLGNNLGFATLFEQQAKNYPHQRPRLLQDADRIGTLPAMTATTYIGIGDIHGLDDRLGILINRFPQEGTLVFLGDYIDRGPSSKEVIERLMTLEQQRACIFLRGNHEAMALDALGDGDESRVAWLRNGGEQTLISYGGNIPADHLKFFERTRPYFITDDYIFVHAGLLPAQQPADIEPQDVLWWIRDPFLKSDYDWGRLVIHGHTPTFSDHPEIRPNRINIDTGAIYGGPLTAILLPEKRFIAV